MDKAAFKLFESTDDHPKFPYIEGSLGPWKILFLNGRRFILWGIIFSLVLSVVSILFGEAFICNYQIYGNVNFYCQRGEALTLTYFLLKLLIISGYMYLWVNSGSEKLKSFQEIRSNIKSIGLIWLMLLLMIIGLIIPMLSFMALSNRIPNPNWQVESLYFTVVAIGFFVPFLLMRLMSGLGYALEGKALPRIKDLWQMSRHNMLRIIFSLFTLFVIYAFFYGNFYTNFRRTEVEAMPMAGIIIEILYNIMTLFFITLLANNTLLQKRYLGEDIKEN